MPRRAKRNPVKAFFIWAPLAIMLFWSLAPIYWILVTAFSTNEKLYSPVLSLFPNPITLAHFRELFWDSPFLRQLRNSHVLDDHDRQRRSSAARPRTRSPAPFRGASSSRAY
jgi:ABC-type glycerol-3-phosphate transport system permease component